MTHVKRYNFTMRAKLAVVVVGMFAFGYALVPLYRAICNVTGINVISSVEKAQVVNTQVDTTRFVTVEFDANARGPWTFKPLSRSVQVHPGELTTVMYEFQNTQNRPMAVQAIPSYAPIQAQSHFNKLQCFCFQQHTLAPGEKKIWPVAFVVDTKLPKEIGLITLSYTFFEVGSQTPSAPVV